MAGLPANWKKWVLDNLLRGVPATDIHQRVVDEGFSHCAVAPLLGANLPADFHYVYDADYFQRLSQPAFVHDSACQVSDHSRPSAQLYTVDNLFSEQECAQLCTLISHHLRPSEISTVQPGQTQSFRTSSTCDLNQVAGELGELADKRILSLFGPGFGTGEAIQAQHYAPGQEFKAHTDYFEPGSAEYRQFASTLGQRTWTSMVYLNEVESGGQTEFAALNTTFVPKTGMAVIWNNLDKQGNINPATLHQAHPVIKGEKVVITKWLRHHC
ncbi:prolyl hydroxylase family protein [Salinimonas lutimaris]|uniref:prolyl hydroxylase family protein n=1 Tax=Salinimonas lutimaris TaxID=914153 RepID=UPI0010C0B76C|nr:2OG-Fe(II) oxygenase [Salinimonas lutimaris]